MAANKAKGVKSRAKKYSRTKKSEDVFIEKPDYPIVGIQKKIPRAGTKALKFLMFLAVLDILAIIAVWLVIRLGIF